MESLSKDPIAAGVYGEHGLRASINSVLETGHVGAAIILIFASIDAMANLDRPASQKFSCSEDFLRWVARYFNVEGETQISAEEWYAARNAIVHTYGIYSRRHKKPGVRVLLWMTDSFPHVLYSDKQPDLVLVDVLAMRDALFAGIDRFLIDAFADASHRSIMEERLQELILRHPVNKP
jgi:hypothetical protein